MNGKTVTTGQVSTRVCLRGSAANDVAPSDRSARASDPAAVQQPVQAFGERRGAAAAQRTASRSAIFSNENSRFVRDSIGTARAANLGSCWPARRRRRSSARFSFSFSQRFMRRATCSRARTRDSQGREIRLGNIEKLGAASPRAR